MTKDKVDGGIDDGGGLREEDKEEAMGLWKGFFLELGRRKRDMRRKKMLEHLGWAY
jgi:hypothetical protein